MSGQADDLGLLAAWWNLLLNREPPPPSVRGLWFGLFNDLRGGATLYVHGFDDADVGDATADWAADDPSWAPADRYVRVPVLTAANRWEDALTAATRLLGELRPWSTWPGELDAIAAGFDDGDPVLIWPPG